MNNNTTMSEMNLKGKKLRQAQNKKKVEDAVEEGPIRVEDFPHTTSGKKGMSHEKEGSDEKLYRISPDKKGGNTTKGKVSDDKSRSS